MPLLSPRQMSAIQRYARAGMTDIVDISRPSQSDSVYGDAEAIVYTFVGSTKAWFRSQPTPVATADVGVLVTINTYRLLVPTGTDIQPKDQVLVRSETYLVTDTTAESTYQPYLQASLRRRE